MAAIMIAISLSRQATSMQPPRVATYSVAVIDEWAAGWSSSGDLSRKLFLPVSGHQQPPIVHELTQSLSLPTTLEEVPQSIYVTLCEFTTY